ncbi:MAG: DUF4038 domain-containing protein [Planctomycetes bacterium]|nr:DUF4038 domain-containing protein [Planctomycetota bacterium]
MTDANAMRANNGTLRVSDNRRFLVHQDGRPFFYLGDTAWRLFCYLKREEADHYLQTRADQGFTVIQASILAEKSEADRPNAYGQMELIDGDIACPNERYFQHVDYIVNKAASLGLWIGMLPTWGDRWNRKWGTGPELFTPDNALAYGRWLGRRYRDRPLIWILGGDRPVETDVHARIIRAMARGLREGDGGEHLMTFHPCGGETSAQYFHAEEWLDFNMRQNGHEVLFGPRYAGTRADYDRLPPKPVIDGEPIYEGHPVCFNAPAQGRSIAADVRRPLYWDLFGGACGHTYGHHSVWQFMAEGNKPVNQPLMSWPDALSAPGAAQMVHGRRLIESRPVLSRIPDDSMIVAHRYGGEEIATYLPGAGLRRFVGTRDAGGSYLMVYAPVSIPFEVDTGTLTGGTVRAWWFNPRTGGADAAGTFPRGGVLRFQPPDPGEMVDWVLVLDDADRGYPPPGRP